jgi:hypothetical protein
MQVTREQVAIWDRAFKAGVQDAGAILIASLIYDGRTTIKVNELKVYIAKVTQPNRELSEHVLELLDNIERAHQKQQGINKP